MFQGRLSDAAAAVKDLLPSYAGNDLSSLCSWADDVKFRYHWSSPLHYIDTPDGLCGYSYDRKPLSQPDSNLNQRCHDLAPSPSRQGTARTRKASRAGASRAPSATTPRSSSRTENPSLPRAQYNLTQALLFLSHFIGDIHQVVRTTTDSVLCKC